MRKFMSLFIEKETDTDFSFDEEALAKEVTDYAIEHEGFPFEAEITPLGLFIIMYTYLL